MKLRDDKEATLAMRRRYVFPGFTGSTCGAHAGLVALQTTQLGEPGGTPVSAEQLYLPRPWINKDCTPEQPKLRFQNMSYVLNEDQYPNFFSFLFPFLSIQVNSNCIANTYRGIECPQYKPEARQRT